MFVAEGFVGTLDLRGGCYTTYEVFELAARDIARRGDVGAIKAILASGRVTVRGLLSGRYGIYLGPREYWHSPRLTPDEADRVEFLRMLKREQTYPR